MEENPMVSSSYTDTRCSIVMAFCNLCGVGPCLDGET